ncbi:MAG: SOS response-associated peptidase [Actinomycetota bacterium]|nr:SOS response-associated peptidase [Actinomycetota bacterium]
MCGRYVSMRSDADMVAEFDAVDATLGQTPEPDYNVAPTKAVRIVVSRPLRDADGTPAADATRQLRIAAWGLVPSWAKDRRGAARMINARIESVTAKPAFRKAYARRRCLVPADGWYEWRTSATPQGARKQPMYMTPSDGHLLAFAGLYEFWSPPGHDGDTVTTCSIITSPAEGRLAEIHDRMPLVLPRGAWARWLDPRVDDPAELLVPWDEARGERLDLRPVSSAVNKVENNGPALIAEIDPEEDIDSASQRLF